MDQQFKIIFYNKNRIFDFLIIYIQRYYKFLKQDQISMQSQNFQFLQKNKKKEKITQKSQKLVEASQIFTCQCSKVYLSFSALYLHVKIKHGLKLTSKLSQDVCRIEQKQGKTYFTFFVTHYQERNSDIEDKVSIQECINVEPIKANKVKNQQNVVNKSKNQSDNNETRKQNLLHKNCFMGFEVKTLIQIFLINYNDTNAHQFQMVKIVLMYFGQYLQRACAISKQFQSLKTYQPKKFIQMIPLLFNEYLTYYLPLKLWSEEYQSISKQNQIQIIQIFGNWLRTQNYTDLIIINNF